MAVRNGIYAARMSAVEGEGLAILVFLDGLITGVDASEVKFDGSYLPMADGSVSGSVTVVAPAGGTLIQGVSTGPSGLTYTVDFRLPKDFESLPYIRFNTPLGPVNGKISLLRAL
jgi:hypothetical protein